MSVTQYQPVAFMGGLATHFCYFLLLEIVENTPGSLGMLENTPSPEIPPMSVMQYCSRHFRHLWHVENCTCLEMSQKSVNLTLT